METTGIAEEADAGGIDWLDVVYFSLIVVLNGFIAIILEVVGALGNIMSIVIFIKRAKTDRVSAQYLGLLAASDLSYLILVAMVSWVNQDMPYVVRYFGGDLESEMMPTILACRIWVYTMNVLSLISSWTLIVFSVERALVMWMPLRMAPVFSSSKPRKIALSLVIICALVMCTGHFEFQTRLDNGDCWGRDDIPNWQKIVMIMLFFILPYAVPLVLISILNILILIGIRRNTMTTDKSNKASKTERRYTINLLLVSFFFCSFILPTTITSNLYFYYEWNSFDGLSAEYLDYFFILTSASLTMAHFNSAINPFIYTYSLSFYRKELVRILCWKRGKRDESKNRSSETAVTDAMGTDGQLDE